MANKFRRVLWTIGGAIAVLLGLALLYFGPQLQTYLKVRGSLTRQPPFPRGWEAVPTPLTDLTPSAQGGTTLSSYGYQFEVPWSGIEQQVSPEDWTETRFRTGQIVRFENTANLKLGYERLRQILVITPSDLSPFSGHREFKRDFELLNAKGSMFEHNPVAPHIYSFQTARVRGFELRYESPDRNSSELYLFGDDDRENEVIISARRGAQIQISQLEINRIIQTFAPAPSISPS
jgi:hypothetical protein